MDFFSILTLVGGLAMFLYGMQVMETVWKSFPAVNWKRFWKTFHLTV